MTEFDEINLTEKEIEAAKSAGRKRAELLFQIGQTAFSERMAELQLEQFKALMKANEMEEKRMDGLLARLHELSQVSAQKREKEMAELREKFKDELPEPWGKFIQDIRSGS